MLDELRHELDDLRARGGLRQLEVYFLGAGSYSFASNDYLNLAGDRRVVKAACEASECYGAGAGASRLVIGTLECHERLEEELAQFLGCESSLVFGAGYLANLGLLASLLRRGDVVILDRNCHASLIDGAVLSRATIRRFRHNDLQHLERILKKESAVRSRERRIVVVTESVFSMDGDLAPVKEILSQCQRYEALCVVDEAHALGVFGRTGAGILEGISGRDENLFITATLSKSLGSYGGIVACSKIAREYLINRARPFIYNTALAPSCVGAARAALQIIQQRPALGSTLLERSQVFSEELRALGLSIAASKSQIVPLMVAGNEAVLQISAKLRQRGLIVPAIRSPTVAKGKERLRFSITLAFDEPQLREFAKQVAEVCK